MWSYLFRENFHLTLISNHKCVSLFGEFECECQCTNTRYEMYLRRKNVFRIWMNVQFSKLYRNDWVCSAFRHLSHPTSVCVTRAHVSDFYFQIFWKPKINRYKSMPKERKAKIGSLMRITNKYVYWCKQQTKQKKKQKMPAK